MNNGPPLTARVLMVDDDSRLIELVTTYLGQNGVAVSGAGDGPRGLVALEQGAFDAVLLDVMMPGLDGLEVCRRIRAKSNVPIIMLTAKGDDTDRVVGLELGADDYLPKPFNPRELLARLRAILRRASSVLSEKLAVQNLAVDVGAHQARIDGKVVELTGLEFDILVALVRRAGRVVPRDALLAAAGRGDVVVSERAIDVHIAHLRQKLGDDPPKLIKTVRGVGYVLTKDGDEPD